MVKAGTIVIGTGILLGFIYLISKSQASQKPIAGTLDIISCSQDVSVPTGNSASISVVVQALNDHISKTLQIVADIGTAKAAYTDSQVINLDVDQTTTVTFTIPNITDTTQYTVSVI